MAGLLDTFFGSPDQTQAMGLLGIGLMRGDFGAGAQAAMQHMAGADDRKLKRGLLEMQIEESRAQANERQTKAEREAAEMARIQGIRQAAPSLFRQPDMTGGEAVPQTEAGIPMFSRPMGVTPMQATPGGFDVQRAIALGMKPEEISAYAALANIGKSKVARTVEVDDGRGGKATMQLDDFGNPVGQALPGYIPPVQVNQGDRVTFQRPQPGVSLPVNMSPDARASNALGWANHGLSAQRLSMDAANAAAGKAPQGYRFRADGTLEAIPGGPADIKAGVEGAKSTQRAQHAVGQADVVIGTIDKALGKSGFFETGLTGAVLGSVPGTDAYDLRRTVETVKANIGFDTLQKMRDMSPTGGALGQVAVQELNMLQATIGNLDANQSQPVLRQNLAAAKKHYENWKRLVQQAAGMPTQAATPARVPGEMGSGSMQVPGIPSANDIAAELARRRGMK